MSERTPRRRLRLFLEHAWHGRAPRPGLAARWWHWLVAALGTAAALQSWLDR